jgi:hypothetical protein
MGTEDSFSGVKRSRGEADRSPTTRIEFESKRSYTSTPPHTFMMYTETNAHLAQEKEIHFNIVFYGDKEYVEMYTALAIVYDSLTYTNVYSPTYTNVYSSGDCI